MLIDVDRKYLKIYVTDPKEDAQWFIAISGFQHRWEFGLTRDMYEDGRDMMMSRYYLYAQHFNREGLKIKTHQFPRKNRWTRVTY